MGHLPTKCVTSFFILIADVLNQLRIGQRQLKIHGPWLRVGFGIVDGDLKIDMPEIAAMESLGQAQGFGSRMTVIVEPVIFLKARRVHY